MLRKVLRAALAVSIVALSVGVASPAFADEAECADSFFAQNGRDLFTIADDHVPPPLLAHPWDCASQVSSSPVATTPVGESYGYLLIWADVPFETVIGILRSFEDAGWTDGTEVSQLDLADNEYPDGVAMGADDLAALEAPPAFVHARFGDLNTGTQTISMTYADGAKYDNDIALTEPSLFMELNLTGTFSSGTGIADPSVLSSLQTIAEAAPNPVQTGVLCTTSVMLMLIVGFPGALLNSVIGARYDQAMAKLRTRRTARDEKRKADGKKPDAGAEKRRPPAWLVWPGFFAAAVIGGFVDPDFGFNWMSTRVLVTAFWGFVLLNLAGWAFVRLVLRRVQPDADAYIKFRWGSLVLVALAVLIARLLQFEPGVIFGLVAGLAFGITLAASRDALVILLGTGFAVVIALFGWVGYSLLAPVADANPGQVWSVFFSEFFSGITVEGISALPLALLPLLLLDGATIFAWKKWVWAISYTVGLAAFMLVLLTIPDAWGEVQGDFGKWVLIFVAFAVLAVGVWGVNALVERRKKGAVPAPAAG